MYLLYLCLNYNFDFYILNLHLKNNKVHGYSMIGSGNGTIYGLEFGTTRKLKVTLNQFIDECDKNFIRFTNPQTIIILPKHDFTICSVNSQNQPEFSIVVNEVNNGSGNFNYNTSFYCITYNRFVSTGFLYNIPSNFVYSVKIKGPYKISGEYIVTPNPTNNNIIDFSINLNRSIPNNTPVTLEVNSLFGRRSFMAYISDSST